MTNEALCESKVRNKNKLIDLLAARWQSYEKLIVLYIVSKADTAINYKLFDFNEHYGNMY